MRWNDKVLLDRLWHGDWPQFEFLKHAWANNDPKETRVIVQVEDYLGADGQVRIRSIHISVSPIIEDPEGPFSG
jgi:hypothetical protein